MEETAADAARLLVRSWSEREAAVAGDDEIAHRAVLICNPEAVGASVEALGEAEAAMEAAFRKGLLHSGFETGAGGVAGSKAEGLQEGTGGLRLEVVWVVDASGGGGAPAGGGKGVGAAGRGVACAGGAGCGVEAGQLKAHVWKLAAAHHNLQVRYVPCNVAWWRLRQCLPVREPVMTCERIACIPGSIPALSAASLATAAAAPVSSIPLLAAVGAHHRYSDERWQR